jgi:hypothetical protein
MAKAKDYTGQKYWMLTFIKPSGRLDGYCVQWEAKCDCGNTFYTVPCRAKRGSTKSCGCYRKSNAHRKMSVEDFTYVIKHHDMEKVAAGKTYERLTVLSLVEEDIRGIKYNKWDTVCICGNHKVVMGKDLKSGRTKSCGCLHIDVVHRKYGGNSAKNEVIHDYMLGAKTRNLEVSISRDDFEKLFIQNCFYCNSIPLKIRKSHGFTFAYNGVDRVDNTRGYIAGNVVPCCKICNAAKSAMSLEDFIAWIERLTGNINNLRQKLIPFLKAA